MKHELNFADFMHTKPEKLRFNSTKLVLEIMKNYKQSPNHKSFYKYKTASCKNGVANRRTFSRKYWVFKNIRDIYRGLKML